MLKLPKITLPSLPKQTGPFPAREWRAHIALIASIFGAIAFTAFAVFLVFIMWKGGWPTDTAEMRIEVLGKALILSLSGALVVLISLGFAINRRMVKITKDGLEASGGGDDPTGPLIRSKTRPRRDDDTEMSGEYDRDQDQDQDQEFGQDRNRDADRDWSPRGGDR